MRFSLSRTLLVAAAVSLAAASYMCGLGLAAEPSTAPAKGGVLEGTFGRVDGGSIWLALPPESEPRKLPVADPKAREKLAKALPYDTIKVGVDDMENPQRITKIEEVSRSVSKGTRLVAIGIAFIVLALVAGLATRGSPARFLIGVDNRYSNSQCQLALWFGAVATIYLAAVALRVILLGWDFVGGVGLPQNLVALTGLSALTFGGAKVITAQKVAAAEQAKLPPPKPAAAKSNLLTDLVQNDAGNADLGDFEMILIALAAAAIFLLSSFHFLGTLALEAQVTLPDVDTTLLSGFGLGNGAYLIKKAALKAGEG